MSEASPLGTIQHGRGELWHRLAVLALGIAGIRAWQFLNPIFGTGTLRLTLIALATAVACLPPVARFIDRVRNPSNVVRRWAGFGIALLAAGYFVLTAFDQQRDLFPKLHDECSYMISVQILAHGRLWMPALPLPDFFDSFYILVRPVYGSIYFVGAALLFVPTVLLHLPTWFMPAMIAGAVVGIVYCIITQLIDGTAGMLAAMLIVSLTRFRAFSMMLTGHIPVLMMGLILFLAWLRWRRSPDLKWATIMGAAAGWAAIIRPADAAIYAAPIGIDVIVSLLGQQRLKRAAPLLVMVLAAAPFLALQAAYNYGATGHVLRSPYVQYLSQDMPGAQFGYHPFNASAEPQSTLLQKREFYSTWAKPRLMIHTLRRTPHDWLYLHIPTLVDTSIPSGVVLPFAFIGLLGLRNIRQLALVATLPLFVLIYACNPFMLEHYGLLIAPAMILLVLLGGRVLADAWPTYARTIRAGFVAMIVMTCIASLWEVNRFIAAPMTPVYDDMYPMPLLAQVRHDLQSISEPAVVLFTHRPGDDFAPEPVYNIDVAWPDNAPIIRAHDLGSRNSEIFAYYAKTEPNRIFYSYDPHRSNRLKRLGSARDLAAIHAK